ncbi:MAG: hypothetical protein KatS3mg054_0149 [Chloroflexus sp.]|nr:MAG: hypothetical protein KatS3mg054_0149 [Chloroflexus sp.]
MKLTHSEEDMVVLWLAVADMWNHVPHDAFGDYCPGFITSTVVPLLDSILGRDTGPETGPGPNDQFYRLYLRKVVHTDPIRIDDPVHLIYCDGLRKLSRLSDRALWEIVKIPHRVLDKRIRGSSIVLAPLAGLSAETSASKDMRLSTVVTANAVDGAVRPPLWSPLIEASCLGILAYRVASAFADEKTRKDVKITVRGTVYAQTYLDIFVETPDPDVNVFNILCYNEKIRLLTGQPAVKMAGHKWADNPLPSSDQETATALANLADSYYPGPQWRAISEIFKRWGHLLKQELNCS